MIDLKLMQKNPELIAQALTHRNSSINMQDFHELDSVRRALLIEVEELKGLRNKATAEIAQMVKNNESIEQRKGELGLLSDRIKSLDIQTEEAKAKVEAWILNVPNIPHESVPMGKDENDNVEVHTFGIAPSFDFNPKEHWELGVNLKGLDFERGAKLAGSRFSVSFGSMARLERAIANFFMDIHINHNAYTEVQVPLMVNRTAMTGTGQLPKFAEDLFKLENWEYFLIPTAEVPLTNLHAGEVIAEKDLPIAYCAATPCFRSEAGAYGKDTKGLIRQHQFNKVEMVRFVHPDDSYNQLEILRGHAENLLERLELPYRTIVLCAGDMGFSATKTYDLEVWLPGQNKYREISSCSNCEDFQARRANIKFKPKSGKNTYVHTLNGSGLAVGRSLVAVLENGQRKDGSIVLPKVLTPYMGGLEVIEPA